MHNYNTRTCKRRARGRASTRSQQATATHTRKQTRTRTPTYLPAAPSFAPVTVLVLLAGERVTSPPSRSIVAAVVVVPLCGAAEGRGGRGVSNGEEGKGGAIGLKPARPFD